MNYPINRLDPSYFPRGLQEIPDPPKTLNYRGVLPPPNLKLLTIVGSRNYTSYGKQCIDHLVNGLRGYPVGIVSGLALGVDSLSHEAALANNLYTLAIPGGGIDDSVLYPARHRQLAHRILAAGGCLLSEFEPTFRAQKWSFPVRNRLQAGISSATLLIEAGEKSGTLITARLTVDYNRELLVVPGSIFSKQHIGIHQFLKLGATPVTSAVDILEAIGIEPITETKHEAPVDVTDEELAVLTLLHEPLPRDELIRRLDLPTAAAASLLMTLELKGDIILEAGMYRTK